ncbi:phosphatidylinositol-glycan biosynthesis class X protein isoform X2 [Ambystoma mexicanum]|uniref:phosphatidylinositol-glycan biosynthesis class X protein isoform X2 n=1 Tax=Ambystoma mexicanum TaxID=8296 RepID=UPI0037E8E9D5
MNDAILTQMDFLMLCLCLALIPLVYSMSPDMDAQAGPLPRQRTKALLTMDTPLSGRPQLVGTEENATKDSEVSGAGATCPEVTVTRKILNEGFHRHLVSQVTIAGFPGPVNGCKVLFKEMLPNGLYLDPYQLASLQEHNLTEVREALPVRYEGPGHSIRPGDLVLTKVLERSSCLAPRWRGPLQVLLVTQTAVRVSGRKNCIHATHTKKIPHLVPYNTEETQPLISTATNDPEAVNRIKSASETLPEPVGSGETAILPPHSPTS